MKRLADVITIPSSDEEDSPKPKRIKPTPLSPEITLTPINKQLNQKNNVVELTDSEDDMVTETNINGTTKEDSDIISDIPGSSKVIINDSILKPDTPDPEITLDEPAETTANKLTPKEIRVDSDLILIEETYENENITENTPKKDNKNPECVDDAPDPDLILLEEVRMETSKITSKMKEQMQIVDDSVVESNNLNEKDKTDMSTPEKNIENNGVESKINISADESSSDEKENTDSQNEAVTNKISENSTLNTSTEKCLEKSLDSNYLLFNDFMELVKETIKDTKYEDVVEKKFPIIKKYYKRAETTLAKSTNFAARVKKYGEQAKLSPDKAVIQCSELFRFIKTNVDGIGHVDIDERHIYKVRKLEKAMKLLVNKIKELEMAEVDFDDEKNSPYIQSDRYQKRLKKVYAKYCQYLKKNPYNGRLTYDRIYFCESKFNEINLAINSRYKNSLKCPEYYKIEKVVKKAVKQANLDLSDYEIRRESKICFEKLASILQRRRKTELYEFHSQVVENTVDPAQENVSLNGTLKKNYEEGKRKIDDVFEMYVRKQEEKQHKPNASSEESEDEESGQSDDQESSNSSGSDSE